MNIPHYATRKQRKRLPKINLSPKPGVGDNGGDNRAFMPYRPRKRSNQAPRGVIN